jgi:hypothetical protein
MVEPKNYKKMIQKIKIFLICFSLILISSFLLRFSFEFFKTLPVMADTATTTLEVGNTAPTVSGVNLNSGINISLIENFATTVNATCTVSDTNGYGTIASVIARAYRSGVTSSEACTIDPNNCYQQTSCATSSCVGSDCVATCQFDIWFVAEPTDAGSDWSSEHWVAWVKVTDASNASSTATSSAQTIEMNTLTAFDVTNSIGYGNLSPGQSNSPLDKVVKATTTGNEAIDSNISGTNMCTDYPTCTSNTTSIAYQHYATSGLAYASTSDGVVVASTSAQLLEFVTAKPTATTSNQVQSIYWGTYVPVGQTVGSYTGVNTFSVLSD